MKLWSRDDEWLAELAEIVRHSGFENVPFSALEAHFGNNGKVLRLNDDVELKAYIRATQRQTNQPSMSDDVAKVMGLPNPRQYREYFEVSLLSSPYAPYNTTRRTVFERDFDDLRQAYDFLRCLAKCR